MHASLSQLNLVVADLAAAVAFYERLGLDFRTTPDGRHAEAALGERLTLELDTADGVGAWDAGWAGATGGGAVLGFALPTREDVDRLYTELVAAGRRAHQAPYDAFWGARYAIVDDPDGHPVGLMGPVEEARRHWPPRRPPRAP